MIFPEEWLHFGNESWGKADRSNWCLPEPFAFLHESIDDVFTLGIPHIFSLDFSSKVQGLDVVDFLKDND